MQDEVLQRCDLRLLPTAETPVVVDFHHVVGEEFAKAHFVSLGFGLQLVRRSQSHGQITELDSVELRNRIRWSSGTKWIFTHFKLLSNIAGVFEWLLQFGCGGSNAADFNRGGLLGRCGTGSGWDGFRWAAAWSDLLLKELDQFVLILDHVAAKGLQWGETRFCYLFISSKSAVVVQSEYKYSNW